MVFRGILVYGCIDLKEDSIKGECCETTPIRERTSTDEHASLHEWSHPSSTRLVDRIRQLILVSKGMSFRNSRVPSWHPSTYINIFPRSMKATVLPHLVHLHSLLTHVSFMLTKSPIQWMSSTWYWDSQSSRGKTKMYEKDKSNLQGVMSVITSHKPKLSSDK